MGAGYIDPRRAQMTMTTPNPGAQDLVYGRAPQSQGKGPYAGNLQTDFSKTDVLAGVPENQRGLANIAPGLMYGFGQRNNPDADVRGAQRAYDEMTHPNSGTSGAEQQALYNMYLGRIGIKNSLAEQIAANSGQRTQAENDLRQSAGEALDTGLRHTRENYSRRGLLYSGQRETGELKERGAVASALESGLSGARRDSANSLSAAQNAYASVDLANQQESLKLANEAFDTASRNNIARMQAMQQLGHGLGSVVGYFAGNYKGGGNKTATTTTDTSGAVSGGGGGSGLDNWGSWEDR